MGGVWYFVLQYSNNPTMDGLRQTLPKFADVPWRLDRILNADAGTPVLPYLDIVGSSSFRLSA